MKSVRLRIPCASCVSAALIASVVAVCGGRSASALIARPYVHGLSFVIRAAEMQGAPRRARRLSTRQPSASARSRSRRGADRCGRGVYEPAGSHHRAALLTSGLHASGIDEPRLVRLAQQTRRKPHRRRHARHSRALALRDRAGDHRCDRGRRAAGSPRTQTLAPDHSAALMGISFSGGLSIVAAGRPSLANRVAYVFSLGGHDDLPRVLRYLCTGREPRPIARRAARVDAARQTNRSCCRRTTTASR